MIVEMAVIGGFALLALGMVVREKLTDKDPKPLSRAEEDEWTAAIK